MIHELVLIKIKNNDSDAVAEKLMVEARIKLLKIPGLMNLHCGKKIVDSQNPYDFFVSMQFDNLSKLQVAKTNSLFVQYMDTILKPASIEFHEHQFEMEPAKDTRYS